MFLHFLKNETKLQYKFLLILILTIMLCLPRCVVAQEGRVYRPEPRNKPGQEPREEPRPGPRPEVQAVYPSGVEGQWILNAGNATGRLEFRQARGGLIGRIWFDVYQKWEELTEISFDPQTGRVQFNRPNANEWYSGTVSGSRISGTYTVTISYPWEGKREMRKASPSKIEGLWVINAGNATGRLELYWTRNILAGRIWFDVYQRWEELTDLSFDRRAGDLEFTRPHGNEHYSGTLSGDQLSGTYSVIGPTYSWEARR